MITAATITGRRDVGWVYRGVWGVLTRWFRVPSRPPELPAVGGHEPVSIRPADAFLSYLKVLFVIGAIGPVLGGGAAMVAMLIAVPWVGILLAPLIIAAVGLVLMTSWVGIHLRFDTQWYVLSDRSVRIRRGIWSIRETTITFENVQDITVLQGPLQRYFGVSDILLETAGGGTPRGKEGQHISPHAGFLQGLANAPEIKELIAARVRASRSAGLGDEHRHGDTHGATMSEPHVRVLREILEGLRATSVG
ncbi:hypothetical protein PHYC_03645 [Phycisphaerales bacterium]|nr:hypothetical protein PHYC_03645 [Phycisphaerales bacterium]